MDYGFIPNLHVILLGDSQRAGAYLPYGKQLVRQLLASRQPYGKRVGHPGSGVLVEAWVSGEHRWVRITAEGCPPFLMESGIIGLQDIGLGAPGLHGNDGVMHYSPAIRTYAADKKLLGELKKPPSMVSTVTPEKGATRALKASVDSEGNRDSDSETQLAYKKLCASRVPPSIFTGKLRLYFQAKYGTKLSAWKFSMNANNAPPSLDWLSAPTESYPDGATFQFHSAHTGIYTDADKQHWLVQLGVKASYSTPNQINIFKMVASPCIERMRSLLRDDSVSDEDKERIEAYILADSKPDPEFCVSKAVSVPVNASLGYGWHFNWDGNKADIVGIETISTGGATYKHRSTHYRISIARSGVANDDPNSTPVENEARRWTASLEQVEQKEWKNFKWQHVIAAPDWSVNQLEIFGAMLGDRFGDGAPIYVFYTRNDLKVVRYSCSGGDAVLEYMSVSNPPYYQGEFPWGTSPAGFVCAGQTIGFEAGRAELRTRTSMPLTCGFDVDGTGIGETDESYSYGFTSISSKTRTYADTWFGDFTITSAGYTFEAGRANYEVVSPYGCVSATYGYEGTVFMPGVQTGANSSNIGLSYSNTEGGGSRSELTLMLVVVPFGDAEAVYLWGRKDRVDTETGTIKDSAPTGSPYIDITIGRGTGQEAVREHLADQKMTVGSGVHQVDNSSSTLLGAHFISGKGVQAFAPSEAVVASAFFAGEPVTHVAQQFWTRTSAGAADTDGAGTNLTGGYDTALNNKPYVFSGWA